MEAKLIDFKQPLEGHLGKINKNQESKIQEGKSKDFNKTLDSVTKNVESKTDNSPKKSKDLESTGKEVEEAPEELEKDDKIQYQNMVNVLNLKLAVEDDSEINLEEVEVSLDERLVASLVTDKNIKSNDQALLEEEGISLVNLLEADEGLEKVTKEDSKELIGQNLETKNDEEVKANPTREKVLSTEVKAEAKAPDENTLENKEASPIILENQVNEESTSEYDGNKQEGRSESKYELVNSTEVDNDSKVTNESFGPLIKEGIEFTSDQPIKPEAPIVEAKEVVKQIVDQVKFDLSESKNEMKLTLKPESLGQMTMNVELAKDGIVAKIMVDNYRTKEIIEGNLIQLKEGIKDTGMEIKTFEVFVGNGSDFDQHSFNQANQFNLKQNMKKLRIKPENNKGVEAYDDGIVEDKTRPQNYTVEGGLNLFA